MSSLLLGLYISIGINMIMFIVAYILKTDILTDISYSISFIIVSLCYYIFNQISIDSTVLFLIILLWGIRIGIYLLLRILKTKTDKRFDKIRTSFIKFFSFWFLQAITVWVVLIPSLFYFKNHNTINKTQYILGFFVSVLGLGIETIADFQKYKFKNNKKNKDRWIANGLWKYSRHPNYLGEIIFWIGVYTYATNNFTSQNKAISLISPIYITLLLIFVSGVPMLEKRANEKWGKNPDYISYKNNTKMLIPWLI